MPGLNTTGKPTPADYNLGRGAVYFADLDATTKRAKEFRHLGNCTAFAINVESESIEHQSSRLGLKKVDKEVPISTKAGLSLTLDEINFQNMALFLAGTASSGNDNSARAAIDGSTVSDIILSTSVKKGYWYDLVDSLGHRLYDLSGAHLVVESDAANPPTTAKTLNTDYEVDLKFGRIFVLTTGTITEGHYLSFTYARQGSEETLDKVLGLTTTKVSGAIKFISLNPANSDKGTEYQFHSVTLKAEGDFSLVGDEFTEMTMTGTAEANETGYPASPVCTITTHADA